MGGAALTVVIVPKLAQADLSIDHTRAADGACHIVVEGKNDPKFNRTNFLGGNETSGTFRDMLHDSWMQIENEQWDLLQQCNIDRTKPVSRVRIQIWK